MKLFQVKSTAALCALLLGVAVTGPAMAANTATVTATLTSVGALSVTNVTGMNFGSWLITAAAANPNDITLVKSPTTGTVVKTDNGTASSALVSPAPTRCEQTVAITGGTGTEDGTIVQMQHAAIGNFGDTDAVLSDITYQTATQGSTLMTATTNYPVTIIDGTQAESVYFGGTVTIAGAVTNGANTATFLVTYNY